MREELIRRGIIAPLKLIPVVIPVVQFTGDTLWAIAGEMKETMMMPEAVPGFIPFAIVP